jgi:hypothetical protein
MDEDRQILYPEAQAVNDYHPDIFQHKSRFLTSPLNSAVARVALALEQSC